MRNMSFIMTKEQMYARTKTVTRRQGWDDLQPGEMLQAIEQGQGLPKGAKVVKMGRIRVTDTRWEPINAITPEDCATEGFPELTPAEFVAMYCKANKVTPETACNRIVFEHLDEVPA